MSYVSSCSGYALNTFQKKNIFTSFILTSDRLVRCGHDHKYYSKTIINDQPKLIDLPINQVNSEDLQLTQNSYYYAYSDTTRMIQFLCLLNF
ncbi:MAG: membrane protein insertion efficiency factor YidD [Flavobacteriales bacterium]|nr:membrane protein insertion efficiency factor YidD [Flavobacteriales bacterium]